MKKLLFIIALFSTITLSATEKESVLSITITNPSNADRRDVPIVVDLHEALGKKAASVQSAKVTTPSLPLGPQGLLTIQEGRAGGGSALIPSQLDDFDGDLIPDELAFVADIPARSTLSFRVECSAIPSPNTFPPRTAAFMKVWDRKYRYPYIRHLRCYLRARCTMGVGTRRFPCLYRPSSEH